MKTESRRLSHIHGPVALITPDAPAHNGQDHIRAAVILYTEHGVVDALYWALAADLRRRGLQVRGLAQQGADAGNTSKTALVALDGGECFNLFQNLGTGSASCNVDPSGVAAASVALRRLLHQHTDLAIVNRFGALEAAGGGFAAEMLTIMAAGIPLLTAVTPRHLHDWKRFTGCLCTELVPRLDAVAAWFDRLNDTSPSKLPSP